VTGRHRFTCDAGGRVRVRQGDRLVVDAWHPEPSTATWEAELVAGDAGALQVEFGSVPGPWRHLRIGAELLDDVRAVVHAWYGGQEVGHAVADVLTGRAEPGGRLPVTWPRDSRQHPGLLNFPGEAGRVRYGEGVHVGRRAYDRLGLEPRFPFGHGGSFTRMDLTGVTARRRGDGIVVSGELANVGERDGVEVVLVDACGLGGVARRLVAYEKVRLAAGERCRVDLEVAPEQLRSWDLAAGAWSPAHGRVELEVRTLVSTSHVDVDLGTDGAGARGS
jgi:beta-glucosidase